MSLVHALFHVLRIFLSSERGLVARFKNGQCIDESEVESAITTAVPGACYAIVTSAGWAWFSCGPLFVSGMLVHMHWVQSRVLLFAPLSWGIGEILAI